MKQEEIICKTAAAYGQSKGIGTYALASAKNELRAAGVLDIGVDVQIMIPDYAFKSRIHTMEKCIRRDCEKQGIRLTQMKSYQTSAVNSSLVMVSGAGSAAVARNPEKPLIAAGMDILATKWIALEGTLRIIEEREEELRKRFAPSFLNQCMQLKEALFDSREAAAAENENVCIIRQITDGGIFASLWNLSKEYKTGLGVELKDIPIRQETIEICEYFRINPYQLASAGSFLMVTANGEAVLETFKERGIEACAIGKITANNDKIIRNSGELRYIDRPAPDEINKIISGRSM